MSKKKKISILIISIIIVIAITIFFCNYRFGKVSTSNYFVSYHYDNFDKGFLDTNGNEETKYKIFNTYSEYLESYNLIDKWAEDMEDYHIEQMEDIMSMPTNSIDAEKERYRESIDERVSIIKGNFKKGNYNKEYFDRYSLLLVEESVFYEVLHDIELEDVCVNNNEINVYISKRAGGSVAGGEGTLFFISLLKDDIKDIDTINVKTNSTNTSKPGVAYKPIIYLYPEKEEKIVVKLGNPEKLIHTYPKYENGWEIIASPDGNLIDMKTGRNLYALYWEGKNINATNLTEGFVVKGEESAKFLEEKLGVLGLTEREANEFIIYWLPQLESNKYNYIRFQTYEEINNNMELNIYPKPDTVIRVMMEFKELDESIEVKEQELQKPNRKGFVVVEWGGTKIEE